MQSCWWFVTWSDSLFHTDWMMFTCGTVWQKWQMKETTTGRLENKKASFIDIKLNPQKNKRHKMKGWEGQGSRCEHADALTKSDGKHSDLNTLKLINKWNAGESEIKGEKKTKRFFICAYPKTCVLFRPWGSSAEQASRPKPCRLFAKNPNWETCSEYAVRVQRMLRKPG